MSAARFGAPGIGSLVVLLDETAPLVSGGYGGWSVVDRQRRKGLTQWDGIDPIRMQVAILFDGFQDRFSQEIRISMLSRMALPPTSGDEPPAISVDGPTIPNPGPALWVIESLAWGNSKVIWDYASDGVMCRLRQDCVVNLLEYVAEDRIAFRTLPPGTGVVTGPSTQGWPKQYIVKDGDTLRSIAAAFYKDSAKWPLIANANGLRDGRSIATGMQLTIPVPS